MFLLLVTAALAAEPIVASATLPDRIHLHEVASPWQEGPTKIRVLLPDNLAPGQKLPVVYLLPVEPRDESRYGDGLIEAHRNDLHNRHQVLLVAPTFAQLPWYADHPTAPNRCQESYFLRDVVPFIEQTYPAKAEPAGRLLAGFSKSGWGAWSLLLRHPDTFGRAAAWDAPLMMDRLGKYGTTPIFGAEDNFQDYKITHLLRQRAASLAASKRLVLLGYGNFRDDHHQMHALLNELKIPHAYRDGPPRNHDWHSGWLAEMVRLLLEPANP